MRRPLLLLLLVATSSSTFAQQQPSASWAVVEGTVVDSATHAPVSNAIVQMSTQSGELRRRMFAGPDGHFAFRNLAPGAYQVTAQKGLVTGAYGRRWTGGTPAQLVVAPPQRHDPITIALLPASSVSGVVHDEHGEPVPGATAYAVPVTPNQPRQAPYEWLHGGTNERGEYAIAGLRPGRYVVFVRSAHATIVPEFLYGPRTLYYFPRLSNPSGPEVLDLRSEPLPPVAANGRTMTYLTTFAPSSTTAAAASVFSFGLGEQRHGVNIRLQTARSARVSGTIVQPNDEFKDIRLELISDERPEVLDLPGPTTVCDGARFVFMSVPPGSYHLRATRSGGRFDILEPDGAALSARMPILVGEQDVDGLVVTMEPGVRVRGRIVSDVVPPEGALVVSLLRLDRFWQPMPSGRSAGYDPGADRFGVLSSSRLTAGEFFFSTARDAPDGWTLKSATVFGRDAIEAPFAVATDDIADILITLTNRRSGVRGVVRDARGPTSEAYVVVFPSDLKLRMSVLSMLRRAKVAAVTADGAYASSLPPGDYFVAAVNGPELEGWPDPSVLEKLALTASRVRVAEGIQAPFDLVVRR